MPQYNITQAKANFADLIEKVMLGEEVIIAKRKRPVAKIVPIRPAKRKPGKGQILHMSEEFDSPLDDFKNYE